MSLNSSLARLKNYFLFFVIIALASGSAFAQPENEQTEVESTQAEGAAVEASPELTSDQQVQAQESPAQEAEPQVAEAPIADSLAASENVTMDFKDADIQNVLKIISYKAGINIVSTPDVMGTVTVKLVDVPWDTALSVILKTYGFGYEKQGNIILVTKVENIAKIQAEEPLKTEIFTLRFLDAQDAMKVIVPILSMRGKISVLYARGQKGWTFGTFQIGKSTVQAQTMEREKAEKAQLETISIEKNPAGDFLSRKAEFTNDVKSKTLLITDTPSSLDRIRNDILPEIDRKPKQVLIETRIMEVNRDKLRDLGIDWGSGATGASTATFNQQVIQGKVGGEAMGSLGGHGQGAFNITPSVFGPLAAGVSPQSAGLELIYRKLTGTQFEVVLHALEEDVHTNTLSAPRVLTMDNQEASILVGYHRPIIKSELSGGTATDPVKLSQTLDYYQEIGIRLNVVPQVSKDGYINMIIHPSVTSSDSSVTATSLIGNLSVSTTYPIIDVREAQTQIFMQNGETVVLGGLLKDVKSKSSIGIPFFSSIPLIGGLFRRDTYDTAKIDLLIFITARILEENEFPPEKIAKLQEDLGKEAKERNKSKKAK